MKKMSTTTKLGESFFNRSCQEVAKDLLGKLLCKKSPGGVVMRGRIVETEMYPGETDRASHSFKKETRRNGAMFMRPGTAYVYIIYGMYNCFNISTKGMKFCINGHDYCSVHIWTFQSLVVPCSSAPLIRSRARRR